MFARQNKESKMASRSTFAPELKCKVSYRKFVKRDLIKERGARETQIG
jgi:hypothetical protein